MRIPRKLSGAVGWLAPPALLLAVATLARAGIDNVIIITIGAPPDTPQATFTQEAGSTALEIENQGPGRVEAEVENAGGTTTLEIGPGETAVLALDPGFPTRVTDLYAEETGSTTVSHMFSH